MKCVCLILCTFLNFFARSCESVKYEEFQSVKFRKLLSETKHTTPGNRSSHNITKNVKVIAGSLKDDPSAGSDVAVLFIVAIVFLSVVGMVIYFLRKFHQLNKSLPTYRYSSLKTEINGYGPDDKNESQALVAVSTEEEDDFDDEDEISPPTLLVQSQTVMPTKPNNNAIPLPQDNKSIQINTAVKSGDSSLDSDDELLQ